MTATAACNQFHKRKQEIIALHCGVFDSMIVIRRLRCPEAFEGYVFRGMGVCLVELKQKMVLDIAPSKKVFIVTMTSINRLEGLN